MAFQTGTVYFVDDQNLLWKALDKVGTPSAWTPGKTYNTGDLIVPRTIQSGQELIMFQCVGFVSRADPAPPTFPLTLGATVIDNNIEWKARSPTADPQLLENNEFYFATETVTVV